jgi:2-oxoacid:acceptor oxidoreductase gamma subunit (pyruvate/2-ketoisovalerate family)/2-oxoacid:acceptor oxidoreductase delta subunit (pyruvate/2-ketoisovalerate family)
MVTAFEILAKVFSKLGDFHVQAFPAFGVERTGAPIQAFLRVAKHEIFNRSNIYAPHLVVIFDESLVEQVPVVDGLKENGSVLVNTARPAEAFHHLCPHVFTIPATRISLELGLGSKSLPIVNAAMIGALLRIFDGDMAIAEEIISQNVPSKPKANADAALTAYDQLAGFDIGTEYLTHSLHSGLDDSNGEVYGGNHLATTEPEGLFAPYWSAPMSANKTGNWRLLTPVYADRTPPCNSNCPAGTDVREFVKKVAEQQFEEAFKVLYRHNPFPGICGRVCPHFCEQNCNRNSLDESLNIGAIERFLGDRFIPEPVKEAPVRHSEKIAVVGSGPAGLTAALRLREKGYDVTVFEALPQAGGMMRTGIPHFRLPDDVLDHEIQRITGRGVRIRYNHKVTLGELENVFDAVITAVGSHVGSGLGLDNEHLVTEGIRFLRQFKLNGDDAGIKKGDKVAIIGGGNTAIDVSRTVLRLGATPVIYYRRTIREMPAIAPEVEEALAEGVEIEFLTAPLSLSELSDNRLELSLTKMELGAPDDSGRRRPVPVAGSEHTVVVNHLVTAIGQRYDDFVFGNEKIKPKQGRVGFSTKIPVFCAGDMAWGGTVTEAIGSGNKVAAEVHAWLRKLPFDPVKDVPEVVLPDDINFTYYLPSARHQGKQHHPGNFFQNFSEVTAGITEEDAVAESARCLHCGDCYDCGNCLNYCPDSAISVDEHGRLRIDYDYCKGCGICLHECPCSAIQFGLTEEESLT